MDESQTQDQEPQREGNTGGCDEDLSSLLPEDPFAASLDQIASGQKTQYEVIGTLRSECQVIRERVDEVHRMVGDIANERETLRLANKELERLGDLHWQQRIVESMVSQLIPGYDLVLGFRAAS